MEEPVCAVVTTYYPNEAFLENMERVASQVAAIIVVDNTASEASREILTKLQTKPKKVITPRINKNEGLVRALNKGFFRAKELARSLV